MATAKRITALFCEPVCVYQLITENLVGPVAPVHTQLSINIGGAKKCSCSHDDNRSLSAMC